jgi:hypothetical protein
MVFHFSGESVQSIMGGGSILDGVRRTKLVDGASPHQFRTRNNLTKTQRTRSNADENAIKSTKLVDMLPLITVWLQVRIRANYRDINS